MRRRLSAADLAAGVVAVLAIGAIVIQGLQSAAEHRGGPAMPDRETDGDLIQKLQRCEPGLCVLPRAYPQGQSVEIRFAYAGLVVFGDLSPAHARLRAEYFRRLAGELERAAAHVDKVVANGCEGTA